MWPFLYLNIFIHYQLRLKYLYAGKNIMSAQYKAIYLTSLFPIPESNSSAFTVKRINALQKIGMNVVVVCPINKTPQMNIFLNAKKSIEFIKTQSLIPDRAKISNIEVHYFKRYQLPQPIFGWFSYLFLYWQFLLTAILFSTDLSWMILGK